MSKIRIDIDTIKKCVADLDRLSDEIKVYKPELEVLIGEIDDTWDGDASEAYVLRLKSYIKQMDKLEKTISEYRNYLNNVKNDFNILDELWNNLIEISSGLLVSPIIKKVVK